jgi:hypothetical protein
MGYPDTYAQIQVYTKRVLLKFFRIIILVYFQAYKI